MGLGLLVVGEVVLLLKLKKWIQIYNDSLNGSSSQTWKPK